MSQKQWDETTVRNGGDVQPSATTSRTLAPSEDFRSEQAWNAATSSSGAWNNSILTSSTVQAPVTAPTAPTASTCPIGYNTPLVAAHSIRTVSVDQAEACASLPLYQHQCHPADVSPSPPLRQTSLVPPSVASSLLLEPRTLLPSLVAPPPVHSNRYYYTVLTLERPSVTASWGLSISYHRDRVMIGSVNAAATQWPVVPSCIRGYWTTSSPVPPTHFFKSGSSTSDTKDKKQPLSQLIQHLLMQPSSVASATSHWHTPVSHVLAVGDCLVGGAGVALAGLALPDISNLLRQHASTTIQLVVYHNERARRAAATAWSNATVRTHSGNGNANSMRPAYAAAQAAWSVMNAECPVPFRDPASRLLFQPTIIPTPHRASNTHSLTHWSPPVTKNNLFVDPITGKRGIAFANDDVYDPEDGLRAALFLPPIDSVPDWMACRKSQWRQRYKVYPIRDDWVQEEAVERRTTEPSSWWNAHTEAMDRLHCTVAVDYWTRQGFATQGHWLQARTRQWQANYSWNVRKRKALEHDCVEIVHLPDSMQRAADRTKFQLWLRVRKNQWQVQRRKRQRKVEATRRDLNDLEAPNCDNSRPNAGAVSAFVATGTVPKPGSGPSERTVIIDAFLEEQERERKPRVAQLPLDIAFLFDSDLGVPDDIVANVFSFLPPAEHGKLLCIDRKTRRQLAKRDHVWRQLCPSRWKLPRRPRKPWHELYLSNLRTETERSRKQWDDVLLKICEMVQGRGQFHLIKHLVEEAEQSCRFDVDYSSGVVCERNCLLNLAVIHGKLKVVRWLIEEKHADIESVDRGGFGPLMNAAWAGDKRMVRYLMSRGADRTRIGRYHYFCPVAEADFTGLTAEQWATKKDFPDIATLLRLGL